jgi:carbon-monoxide dehydrogenase medium subunit
MIPAPFTYLRASTIEEALSAAAQDEDAKYLAGGHSLLPMMKLRFAVPTTLIDIGRIPGLDYISDHGDHIAIGALTRHHDLNTSSLLTTAVPLLAHAAGEVGDPQVRHRGTIGGSVAHGDPASDLPAVLLALDATFVTNSGRAIPATEFFRSLFETALEPGELLTEIRVPRGEDAPVWSFIKFRKRAIDWAIVGVAVQGNRVGLINMGQVPIRAAASEAALAGGASVAEAAALAADGTSPSADIHASAAYREHLARVLTARALTESRTRNLYVTGASHPPMAPTLSDNRA